MNISLINRRLFYSLAAAVIFLAVIIFTSPSAQAYENISPSSLNLYQTASLNEDGTEASQIQLSFYNDPTLYKKTAELKKEITENGYEFDRLSLQVQLKIDDSSWKTYKIGYFGDVDSDSAVSKITLSDIKNTDLSTQTVYAKLRYAWLYNGGNYYSSWSETAALGKNASSISIPKALSTAPSFEEVSFDANPAEEAPHFNIEFGELPSDVIKNMTNPKGTLMINVMISENGAPYRSIRFQHASNIKPEQAFQCEISDPEEGYKSGTVKLRARFEWYTGGATYYGTKNPDVVSPWSEEITTSIDLWSKASDWAVAELKKADASNLIPVSLMGKDLTKSITRAEFAATAVKAYELLSGKTAKPSENSPFNDCNDAEVLKAYALGIVNGVSATSFAPDKYLSREQAAVMMTRVYKLIYLKDWSLEADEQYKLEYDIAERFIDDPLISAYAKDSVYFMATNNVINGIGNNLFAPKNTTPSEEKKGYANTTRQQALLIAVRMTEAFK